MGVTTRDMSIHAGRETSYVSPARLSGSCTVGTNCPSRRPTGVIGEDVHGHSGEFDSLLRTKLGARLLHSLERVGEDLDKLICDRWCVASSDGVPQLGIPGEAGMGFVEAESRVGDLYADLVEQTEQEVGDLWVEGLCRRGRRWQKGDEGLEEVGPRRGVGLHEQQEERVYDLVA